MPVLDPAVATARNRHNVLIRHHGEDDPVVAQAREALALARTEYRIRKAIEEAPPLDADTLARIRSLIPPPPTDGGGGGA